MPIVWELVTSFTCQSRSRLRIKIHLWSLQTNSDGGAFISQSLLLVLNIFITIFKGVYFAPSLLNLWLLQKNICRWSIVKFLTVFEYLKFFKYGYLSPSLFPWLHTTQFKCEKKVWRFDQFDHAQTEDNPHLPLTNISPLSPSNQPLLMVQFKIHHSASHQSTDLCKFHIIIE